jgi:hypothetical protein
MLSLSLMAIAVQLMPVPVPLRDRISPAAAAVEQQLLLAQASGVRSLSLDAEATAWALATACAIAIVFWSARSTFERAGGIRGVCRAVAWLGLALAVVAFVQRAVSPTLIYGFWQPLDRASQPTPWGPFVNRNDFATWLIMAVPLVVGYSLARLETRSRAGGVVTVDRLLDWRTIGLLASTFLMVAALLASLSRSGLMGLAAGLAVILVLAGRRLRQRRLLYLTLAIGAGILAATAYADLPALAARMESTLPSGLGGRLTVWRETWPMVGDFPVAGVGAGAFARAMLVYQQSTRLIFFNHAHNEYLQILVEGGLLLALPLAAAACFGLAAALRAVRTDRTPMFWIRAGAVAALAAVAVQSAWDTGLLLPANAVLFAIAGAIAVHDAP